MTGATDSVCNRDRRWHLDCKKVNGGHPFNWRTVKKSSKMSLITFLLFSKNYVFWRAVRPCDGGRKLVVTWQLELINGSTFDPEVLFRPLT